MSESSLPAPEQIENEVLMQIVQVIADRYPSERKQLAIELVDADGTSTLVDTEVYTIDHPETKGLLPSKIWYSDVGDIVMMFYINATLPREARPLGDQQFCVFEVAVPPEGRVRYDIYTQVFIDQLRTPSGKMNYVFICAEKELQKLLVSKGNQ